MFQFFVVDFDLEIYEKNESCNMGHVFMDVMRQRPEAISQIDAATGESETNASVLSRSIRLAQSLRRLPLRPGDVLALAGRNHLDLHIPSYAALMNGLPLVGVDPQFKFDEIKSLFKISQPKVAFCQLEQYKEFKRAARELALDIEVITFDAGDHSMASFIQQHYDGEPEDKFEIASFDPAKVYAWLVSTGGSTGVIKLAAFTHRTLLQNMFYMTRAFAKYHSHDNMSDVIKPALNLSPVQWVTGFFNALSMPLMRQIKVQTSAPATAEHVIDIINTYKPTGCLMGPSLMNSILKSKKKCDLTCFGGISIGGSKLYKDIIIEFRKRARPDLVLLEVYGQTENLGPIFNPNPEGPIGNCGKGSYPWRQAKLVDPDTGKEVTEPNVLGELWTKGLCFSEYYNNPEETANVFTADGWFKTGDMLYRDEEGNYFFVERLSMLFKYRSYPVMPLELEEVIRDHSGVLDVSVSCVPHRDDGEHPVAAVVRAPHSHVTAQEIKDLVASKLSDSKQLRGGVVFMEELPYTSSGKIARGKLREMILNLQKE